ncbi:phage tail length tape measure family protein [Mesorhizobium sp.]|uniref:phage tail length tape measure family protein n=1 Tax=Mesorhizobium sp. TaxID=1871066 RepID=UPI003BAB8E61
MTIEAERLLAIFEAKFDALDKALAKSRAAANQNFAAIEAAGKKAEDSLAKVGSRGTPGIDKMAKSIQGAKVQTSNLAAQLNDIGVQLAGGQSPFLIALQQGTQINQALGDAGAKGAITALGGAFSSLINPVGLATIAIITLGGAALQYFTSLFSNGEKSAEQLEKEAGLIQQVASKWGDALPALKAYAEERQKLADQKSISEATQIGKEGAFEDTRTQVNDLRAELAQLIADLATMGGQEAQVGRLQSAFAELDDKVKDQTATSEDAQRVQEALASILAETGIPAAEGLAGAFDRLAAAIANASGQAKAFTFDEQIKNSVLSPLGTLPPVFSSGGGFQDENQVQTDRANATKSQYQTEQDKLARSNKSGLRRLTADDKIGQDIQAIRDRTAALQQEASMIGLSFEEQQRRRIALDLEQAALKQLREEAIKKGQTDLDSIHLSPEQVASINAVAEAYAKQAQQLKEAREAQALQRDLLQGAFGDLRSALDDGKLDWQDLGNIAMNALDKIIDKIENDLIDAILQANSAAGGGSGILGTLLGALGLGGSSSSSFGTPGGFAQMLGIPGYAGGTDGHPGGLAWVGERGRELVNLPKGSQVLPHDVSERVAAGSSSSSVISPVFAPTINMDGGNGDAGEQVAAALKKFEQEFTGRVVKSIRQAKITGMLA